ncbi:MAG TPA: DUF2975 domain-containing protein [Sphingomicrobium sp.]|jgi:hypothetical protein
MRQLFAQIGLSGEGARALDPLLTAARVLLFVLLAGVILAMAFSVFGLVIYVIEHLRQLFTADERTVWDPVGTHLFGLGALSLVASSVLALLAMIGAVEKAEAFDEGNVGRIEKIAGNILGLQLLGLVAFWSGFPVRGDINGFDIAPRLSPGGVAIVLLLFILARVFRQGAAMREDLQGTV